MLIYQRKKGPEEVRKSKRADVIAVNAASDWKRTCTELHQMIAPQPDLVGMDAELARKRLWAENPECRQESKRSAYSGLRSSLRTK